MTSGNRTEHYVWIKSAEAIVPISETAAKRFELDGGDGPNLQLLVRHITVSEFLDRNGEPFTVPADTNVKEHN
jgi:hypothetical protein